MSTDASTVFRPAFFPVLGFMVLFLGVFSPVITWGIELYLSQFMEVPMGILWLGMVSCILIVALMNTGIVLWSFSVEVNETGLLVREAFGKQYTIEWEKIRSVSPQALLHLKCLNLSVESQPKPIVIPLFLDEKDDFCKMIERFIPSENPLRQAVCGNAR